MPPSRRRSQLPRPLPDRSTVNRLRSARWVLLGALLLTTAAAAWRISWLLRSRDSHAIGNGRDPATYGFDLANFTGTLATLVAAGLPRDGLRALDQPAAYPAQEFPPGRRGPHGKILVADDRVVGIAWDGAARAYPLRVLAWHEVVNDTLGGVPVAVTYSPLCDAAAVYDRCADAEVLAFGVSGLLYNSNTLYYDRRSESLWCQFTGAAVAGPAAAAGRRLRRVPFLLTRWADWKALHPATGAVAGERDLYERYVRDPYVNYFGSRELRFPVTPMPPADGPPLMTPMVGVFDAAGELRSLVAAGEAPGEPAPLPPSLHDLSTGSPALAAWGLWFAWHTFYPGISFE